MNALPLRSLAALGLVLGGCTGEAGRGGSEVHAEHGPTTALEPLLELRRNTFPALMRPGERLLSHRITASGCEVSENSVHAIQRSATMRDRTDRIDLRSLDPATIRIAEQSGTTLPGVRVSAMGDAPALNWLAEISATQDGRKVEGSGVFSSADEPHSGLWFLTREMADSASASLRRAIAICRAARGSATGS